MLYLMIIIVAAIAGITRLALQHKREQKMHLLDDFRSGLERLSTQPLPSQRSVATAGGKRGLTGRFMSSRRPESPRGQWDRIAPPTPAFATEAPSREPSADSFFGTPSRADSEVVGHASVEPSESMREFEEMWEERSESKKRTKREPLLAGRLWRKPREPWFWTYEKKAPRARAPRVERDEYVDFFEPQVNHVVDGGQPRSAHAYRYRSPHASPSFTHPRGVVGRSGLDPNKREAAKRRIEARRRTGSHLS